MLSFFESDILEL